ncbi:MAG: anti-sigma factor [Nitrospirae bacterium]|nr:anti-sigma factor [Nitrospirota bacterium]
MEHEQYEEAIPPYVVGALDRDERQALDAHLLSGCPTCPASLKEYRATAGLLPSALPPTSPPADLKTKLLEAVRPAASEPDVPHRASLPRLEPGAWLRHIIPPPPSWIPYPALALVTLLLLAGAVFYALSIRSQAMTEADQRRKVETALQSETARIAALQRQVAEQERTLVGLRTEVTNRIGSLSEIRDTLADQEAELEQLRAQLAQREQGTGSLRKALAQRDEMLAFLQSPRVKVLTLAGLERAKSAGALLLYDAESKKAFFYAFNMPPLPAGKTYQLWAILDKPISAGTFGTDAGHKSLLTIKTLPDPSRITKFAVSLEPAGGRPQPTGAIYLIGQF